MGDLIKLKATIKQEAKNYIETRLSEDRGAYWAMEYHRKLRKIIEEDMQHDKFYEEYWGEITYSMGMMVNVEVEQALRALIDRIVELQTK